MHAAEIYADVRTNLTAMLRSASEAEAATPVPACPEWTVKDCVAHLAGVATDVLAGRVEGAATDPWTRRQVEERANHTLAAVLDEWDESGPRLEEVLAGAGEAFAPTLALDAASHEHDVLEALGRVDARRESAGVAHGTQVGMAALHRRLEATGLPALEVVSGDESWTVGAGEPAARVEVDRYELFRALVGRRSRAAMRAFTWQGDAAPYVEVFSIFSPPAD